MTHDISFYVKDWEAPIFNADPAKDVSPWIDAIRDSLAQRDVPRQHWVLVAFHFLGDDIRTVLREQMMGEVELAAGLWDWDTFTRALIYIDEQLKKDALEQGTSFNRVGDIISRLRQQPGVAAAAGLGLVALGGITVAPAVGVGALNLLGFSASGIVSGSIAAGIQSTFYGGTIASGSAFALAQSAAAGGIVVASAPIQAASAGVMALGAWVGLGRPRNDPADGPHSEDDDAPILLKDERSESGAEL